MKHLILGNGPAGVIAAETLRHADPSCDIVLAGSEDAPPYSRMAIPYLLARHIDEAGTYLRKAPDHYAKLRIAERRGRAVALNTDQHSVLFADGTQETYDRLLVATGSHPIRPPIPGIDLPQVLTCWTLEDARAIAEHARPGSRVVQLGAGFIGCIIMEALSARGVELTVVEMGDRMVPRMMTPKAGNMIRRWVESKGIRVITQAGIDRIDAHGRDLPQPASGIRASFRALRERIAPGPPRAAPSAGAPLRVHLTTGSALDCDLLIVSAGVAPNVGFLEATQVHVAKGVLVNDRMETSVPGIFAAGDVAEAPDIFTGAHLVSAIQPNAADQARVAALNMAGRDVRLPGVLAINVLDTLGLVSSSFGQWWGTDDKDGVELVDEDHRRYLSLQFQGDVLIGATSIGLTQHVGVLRGLIQNKTPLGPWKRVLQE
ncbi:MAG TPA: FAD-dependent oxidoreductase, partial [Chromatiaceae bacterium]|nr:FAD-dependent oxidoreductase [Chromatiaceae bacterium]